MNRHRAKKKNALGKLRGLVMSVLVKCGANTLPPIMNRETATYPRLSTQTDCSVESMVAGNADAFEFFYGQYQGIVHAHCMKKLKNESDANEVLSEIFFEFWQKVYLYDTQRGTVESYLFTIARSRIVDCLRRKFRRDRVVHCGPTRINLADIPERTPFQPMQEIMMIETNVNLRNAIEELDERLNSILKAFYYEGLTHQQISGRYLLPLGTVKSLIRQAIALLRSDLRQR